MFYLHLKEDALNLQHLKLQCFSEQVKQVILRPWKQRKFFKGCHGDSLVYSILRKFEDWWGEKKAMASIEDKSAGWSQDHSYGVRKKKNPLTSRKVRNPLQVVDISLSLPAIKRRLYMCKDSGFTKTCKLFIRTENRKPILDLCTCYTLNHYFPYKAADSTSF